MAQCYLRDDAAAEAMATLKDLLATATAGDVHRAPAQFLLGEALSSLGSWKAAEAAYQAHLALAPELQYLTWQRIAAQRQAQNNTTGAAEAYRQALMKSPDWTNTVAIRRNLADLALAAGNTKEAVTQYDALRANATTGAWAAEMQYLSGNALAQVANTIKATGVITPTYPAEAVKRWQAAIDADNTSVYAHSSVVALLGAGAPVDEFQRGVAVAYCDSPGPLDKGLDTYYAISPIPEDWDDAQVTSFLREYNKRMIHVLSIHEAMPGHYLEGAHSAQHPSTLRAALRSGPFAEGWAVYTERVVADADVLAVVLVRLWPRPRGLRDEGPRRSRTRNMVPASACPVATSHH